MSGSGGSRRAQVLDAAREALAEEGYEGLTAARVSARAKMSTRAFHDLFADREECFMALFDEALREAQTVAQPAFEGERRWRDRMRVGLAALLGFLDREPDQARILIVDALCAGPRVAERRGRVLARLAGIVHEGGVTVMDPDQEAPLPLADEGIVAAVFGVLYTRIQKRDPRPLRELRGPLMAMIVAPYMGTKAARKELLAPGMRLRAAGDVAMTVSATERVGALKDLPIRLTELTVCTLAAIAQLNATGVQPSNNDVCWATGDTNKGQISRLLQRLERLELIENTSANGNGQGGPNAWRLAPRGEELARRLEFGSPADRAPRRGRRRARPTALHGA